MPRSPDAASPGQTLRLLGLAFAGADLVFEIDAQGVIAFVLGAAERLTGYPDVQLIGRSWAELVSPDDTDMLGVLLAGLQPGERQGPLRVAMAARKPGRLTRYASLSVCRLPQLGGRVSCALSLGAPVGLDQAVARTGGLMNRETFAVTAAQMLEEAERAGLPLRLDLVELAGLAAKLAGLEPEAADEARRRIAATLRAESYAGLGAAEIAQDRFALVRSAHASTERLAARVNETAGPPLKAEIADAAFEAGSPSQNLRAMRYALDRFIEDGPTDAAKSFRATVERTVRDTARFKTMLAGRTFHLAYQPVVALKDERLHHFEALARFDANASPADTIRLAEELDMISEFDLAVIHGVVAALGATPEARIAANIGAGSLMNPRFLDELAAATAHDPAMRPRMLLEVTETGRLDDLDSANQIITRLRKLGHVVCLDDFGAGGASLDYLRKLEVDVIKIDGRYIQGLVAGSRDAVVVKHMVALCQDLGVVTVAEMIETPAASRVARELGVDLGQGWAFSKPLPEPRWLADPASVAVRRAGAREEWG